MPRKLGGSDGGPANDEPAVDVPGVAAIPPKSAQILSMTTSPAFDLWLDRQMKFLLAACTDAPDQALVDLIHRELAKRDDKVTE